MNVLAFLAYALIVYASLIGIAIRWSRHCFPRQPSAPDEHHPLHEAPPHVR